MIIIKLELWLHQISVESDKIWNKKIQNYSLENFPSKQEIQTSIKQIDVLQPKAIELEIKGTLENVQRNINTLGEFQKIMQELLEDLKRLVNNI